MITLFHQLTTSRMNITNLNYLEIPGKYFDCGTITEYREALNWSLM